MQRIRVGIRRAEDGMVTIEARFGGEPVPPEEIPSLHRVWNYLPAEYKRHIRRGMRYGSITSIIARYSQQIPDSVWADAIRMALRAEQPSPEAGETIVDTDADGDMLKAVSAGLPCYIMTGDRMYRMHPVSESTAPEHMRTKMKRQMVMNLNQELAGIRQAAEHEARQIIMTAEQTAMKARRELEELRKGNQLVIPQWVPTGMDVRRTGVAGRIAAAVHLMFAPTEIVYPGMTNEEGIQGTLKWRCEQAAPLMIKWWLAFSPLTGGYAINQSFLDPSSPKLPHANTSFCVNPQGMPKAITDLESLEMARAAVERAFGVINLGSLLTNYGSLREPVLAFFPRRLRDRCEGRITNWFETGGEFIPDQQEHRELWTTNAVPVPVPVREG